MPKSEVSKAAKALSARGASKGGKARAKKLSAEERRDIAKRAAEARWGKGIPVAEYEGEVRFADIIVPCAVLSDHSRVLSERGVTKGFGLKRAGSNWQRNKEGGARLPVFASANNLKPFMDHDLRTALITPIPYRPSTSRGSVAHGVKAELIPQICDVWLRARDAGALKQQQFHIAIQADLIMRGLAHVGIIALVDEATGYQADRSADALEKILAKFISKELCKWVRTFPPEFYRQLFRLRNINASAFSPKRPQYVGHLTNNIVYKRLAPGILGELRKLTPKNKTGRRKHNFHQRLSEDAGHPKLREHLASVIALMKACDDWDTFQALLDRALPKYKEMPLFDHLEE